MNRKKLGFTLIEIAVTFAVLAIATALGIGIIFRALPKMRIRGDAWNIHQTLLNAKMTAVAEKVNIGVMFVYRGQYGGDDICKDQDCYFIFKDANGDNQYTNLDGRIFHQCEFIDPTKGCTVANEDIIIGRIKKLHSANTFHQIFGTFMNNTGQTAAIYFNALGNSTWYNMYTSPNVLPFNGGEILIRTRIPVDKTTNRYVVGGVSISKVAGNISIIPPQVQ